MRPRKKILCVMPNEQELSVLKYMLEINGYRVVGASIGIEAIVLFREIVFDLVLADWEMPNMSGRELVSTLKGISSHVPMVLLVRNPTAIQHRADALLTKACLAQELLDRVKVMSARKRGPRKGMARVAAAMREEEVVV